MIGGLFLTALLVAGPALDGPPQQTIRRPAGDDQKRHAAAPKEKRTGVASYMAKRLEGQKTASGEIYDGQRLVAAHPTYPMGTVVRVTNLENGRVVEVTIVDRSAGGRGRPIIDVSRAAAERLGMIEQGVVKVTTEVVGRRETGR